MRAVNLIPSEQRRGASVGAGRSEGGAYAVLGLFAGVAVLAFLYGHAKHQVSSRSGEVASQTARAHTLQSEVARLNPYTSFIKLEEGRVQAVSSVVDSRFDWAHAFHEFGRVLPANISINSLTGTIGSAVTSSSSASTESTGSTTPPGSIPTFTLVGCATSQRAVALMLQRLRLIDGVSEVTLQSSTKSTSAGGGSGSCPAASPLFTAAISFQALPSTSEAAAAATAKSSTQAVADTSAASAAPATSTTTGGTR